MCSKPLSVWGFALMSCIFFLATCGRVNCAPTVLTGAITTVLQSNHSQLDVIFHSKESYTELSVRGIANSTNSTVECPSSCTPGAACRCIVQPPDRNALFYISASKNGSQEETLTFATSCPFHGLGTPSNETSPLCVQSTSNIDSSVTIDNGVGCYNSTLGIGSSATYECTEGFELRGSNMRTCLYNGSWSPGTTPECVLPASTTPSSAGIQTLSVLLTTVALLLAHTIS